MTGVDSLVPVTFRIEMEALRLMRRHGLITGSRRTDWQFRWGRGLSQAGLCTFPHRGKPGVISLSEPIMMLWTDAERRDTILHEIAHALAGPVGHGPQWQAVCRKIGAKPEARYDSGDGREMPQAKYTGTCERGHTFRRSRLPAGPLRCKQDKTRITWEEN